MSLFLRVVQVIGKALGNCGMADVFFAEQQVNNFQLVTSEMAEGI